MSDRNRRGGRTTDTYAVEVQDTFTRPANTTQYAANDAIAATASDTGTTVLRSLALASYPGKPFWLVYLRLETDLDTFTPQVRVHLFNVAAPDTAVSGDNVAFTRAYANTEDYIGYVDLPAQADVGDETSAYRDDVRMLCAPAAATTNVYYRLEIISGTPTPSSGQSFTLTARAVDA
jgi:hypothetical protein